MKNKIFLLAAIVSLWSCGGGGGDTPPPAENKAPSTSTLSTPTNGELCIDNSVSFSWNTATDPDGDNVTYLLEIATNSDFSENKQEYPNLISTSRLLSLDKGTAYYWRVKAKDSKNLSGNYSATFNFYTEADGVVNYLPFSPSLVAPELNTIVSTNTATLEWNCSDVDNDPLTYTVYLGTSNPPTEAKSTNQSEKTFTTETLPAGTYFWKVDVSDNKGGTTIGQVWSFEKD